MLADAIKTTGLTYSKNVFKNITYEYFRKTLADGTHFITLKKTMPNGDVYTKTAKDEKLIIQTCTKEITGHSAEGSKNGLYTEVRRFLPNGDVSITERLINYYNKMVLAFQDRDGYSIIPTKKAFPTKEIITTTDLYRGGGSDAKRIFAGYCQDSPIGQSCTCNFLSDNAKVKEIGVLRTKFFEKQGRLVPDNLNIRYVK